MNKKFSIIDRDWDYLIILDACRYDYFEKVYEDYLNGKLKKVVSSGSETSEWCRKVFTDKYDDIVYVSGNPRINSKMEIKGFHAGEHFHKVIDVWDWGWDKEKDTVRPQKMNEAALKAREDFPDKKLIVHYMQPHAPYLSLAVSRCPGFKDVNPRQETIARKIGYKLTRFLGQRWVWKIRKFFRIQPRTPMYLAFREVGEEGLIRAYEENLREALEYVAKLCSKLPGKIAITADHGELLGESRNFGHYANMREPALTEVPWFVVKSERETEGVSTQSEMRKIKNKVKELKQLKKI
jgi:hypothetical protein